MEWLTTHFLPDIERFDAVIGYRADDSYFSFARAFVNNEISLKQLSYAMKLGELGEQFVLKSEKAFSAIRFISCEQVSNAMPRILHGRGKGRPGQGRSDASCE